MSCQKNLFITSAPVEDSAEQAPRRVRDPADADGEEGDHPPQVGQRQRQRLQVSVDGELVGLSMFRFVKSFDYI
jgi:hypothetical protein